MKKTQEGRKSEKEKAYEKCKKDGERENDRIVKEKGREKWDKCQ